MRLRHIKNAENNIYDYDIVLKNSDHIINLKEIFNNNNPIELELGMGKGNFICKKAIEKPDTNYIGIEKYATVVLYAIKTYENNKNLIKNNLRYLCMDIKDILNIFEEKSINKIYLNFSDPWPKKRHENRRLTSKDFLDKYKKLLVNNGTIEFKTDNISLFDYSLESFKNNNFKINFCTYDLHNENIDNIMTEYEEKFANLGNKICKIEASILD